MPVNPSLTATTRTNFAKLMGGDVANAVTNATPLFRKIKQAGNIATGKGGLNVRPNPVRYRKHTISLWTGRNTTGGYEPDLYTYPTHEWGGYQNLYFDNEFDNLANQGEEELADMVREFAKALTEDWPTFFEGELFQAATTGEINGLQSFMKITGTYGTLSQAAQDADNFYWWAPTVINGTTGLTGRTFKSDPKMYMKRLANTVANRNKSGSVKMNRPLDFAITTQDIWEHLSTYYENNTRQNITVSTDTVGLNSDMIMSEGMEVYWSQSCPSGYLFALAVDKMYLWMQTKGWFGTRTGDVMEPISNYYQSWWKGQLFTNEPRRHGVINTISV